MLPRFLISKPRAGVDLLVGTEFAVVVHKRRKIAHQRVGALKEPRAVEADCRHRHAGFFLYLTRHGAFERFRSVDIACHQNI